MSETIKTLHASAAETASHVTPVLKTEGLHVACYLDVTAASGTTPTLDIDIQAWDPVSGKYFTVVSFTQATGTTTERKTIANCPDGWLRANVTIGGTSPSFTYSLSMVS